MDVNLLINNKIKALVKERKLSLSELASKIGMSEPGFHRMLKEGTTKVSTLQAIADELKVSINYFFNSVSADTDHEIDRVFEILKSVVKSKLK